MDENPMRRWFRFRLSTVLILTAIVAWGMACRPYVVSEKMFVTSPYPHTGPETIHPPKYGSWYYRRFSRKTQISWMVAAGERVLGYRVEAINERLLRPTLALALFVVWKSLSTQVAILRGHTTSKLRMLQSWKQICIGGSAITGLGILMMWPWQFAMGPSDMVSYVVQSAGAAIGLGGAIGWITLGLRERAFVQRG